MDKVRHPKLSNRYRVLAEGRFPLDKLKLHYDERDTPCLSHAQREEVERVVSSYVAIGRRIDQDADGSRPPLYRLRGYSVDNEELVLHAGKTDFGEYLATNVRHPEWRHTYGDKAMSDALAMSAATVTDDNLLLWGKRSAVTAGTPNAYHVLPSGHPHPPNPISTWLYQELEAETGISVVEVTDVVCTGLILSLWNNKPELTFFLKTSVTFSELQQRKRTEAWEFAEVYGLSFTHSAVSEWLIEYRGQVAPPGHAAVLLAGQLNFGTEWCNHVIAQIRRMSNEP